MLSHSCQLIQLIKMNYQPCSYSLSTLPLIVQDVEKRSYFFRKAFGLLEKKAEMDINYSNLLESIILKEYHRPANESIPTQYLYNRIVEYCLEQCKRIRKVGDRLKQQSLQMQNLYDKDTPEQKKYLILTQSISKDFTSQREKIEKSRIRFEKKNKDLEQAKIEYLCSYLSNEQLQKKNQLYLEVNSLEESAKPLREEYESLSKKYNDMIEVNIEQFKSIMMRIESAEVRKINMMKQAVRSYLEIQKDSLDQTLRNNPFRRAKVDSINEYNEFNPHTEEIIDLEKTSLLFSSARESEFVDSIYERIESKKNLDQIILYGQTRQHKKKLNSIIMNGMAEESEFSPKTKNMIEIFKNTFEGEMSESMFDGLKILLRNDENIRKDFILCLQKFRINSQFQLKVQNKGSILRCLNIFLDICNQELDTYNSKMLMVLSLTYYFIEDERKIELQELISEHSIWKRIGWWQAALLESIFEETRVKLKKEEIPITIWDIKAGGVSRKEQGQQLTHQHICFNQVLYYIRNMALFHLQPQQIVQYAKHIITLLKFTGKFARDILDLCPQNGQFQQQSVSVS